MPHVIVKMVAGRTEEQKQELTRRLLRDVAETLVCPESDVSVEMEDVKKAVWMDTVFANEIQPKWDTLYAKPDYK